MCTLIFWIAIYQLHGIGRKSLMLLNFKQQLFSSSPPLHSFCIHARHAWFHKLANHVKELFPWHWKLTQTFFEYFLVFFLGVLVRCFWDFVHVNLLLLCLEFCKKFWVFISGKCCGSLSKFNIYFLQSLHSHLFFCKCIFLRCYLIQSEPLILYLYNGIQE